MAIYVQSRGFSQDDDYCWLPEVPPIIRENRVNDLIQSESFSVVLARYSKKLLLLITGLTAQERTDFRGRKIRNSVAWVLEDSEASERELRAIAASALRDSLATSIDNAIKFGGIHGFEVAWDDLDQLNPKEVCNFSTILDRKIGQNSPTLRDELAYELEECPLPPEKGALVVVTGIKSESALIQAGVWRGLSNLVQAEGWKDPYKKSLTSEAKKQLIIPTKSKNNTLVFLIVSIAIVVVAIALVPLLLKPKL